MYGCVEYWPKYMYSVFLPNRAKSVLAERDQDEHWQGHKGIAFLLFLHALSNLQNIPALSLGASCQPVSRGVATTLPAVRGLVKGIHAIAPRWLPWRSVHPHRRDKRGVGALDDTTITTKMAELGCRVYKGVSHNLITAKYLTRYLVFDCITWVYTHWPESYNTFFFPFLGHVFLNLDL